MRDNFQPRLYLETGLKQAETLSQRNEMLQLAGKALVSSNKDDFYSKLMGEIEEVNKT